MNRATAVDDRDASPDVFFEDGLGEGVVLEAADGGHGVAESTATLTASLDPGPSNRLLRRMR